MDDNPALVQRKRHSLQLQHTLSASLLAKQHPLDDLLRLALISTLSLFQRLCDLNRLLPNHSRRPPEQIPRLGVLERIQRPQRAHIGIRQTQNLPLELRKPRSLSILPVQLLQSLDLERIGVAKHDLLAQRFPLTRRRRPTSSIALVLVQSKSRSLAGCGFGDSALLLRWVGGE